MYQLNNNENCKHGAKCFFKKKKNFNYNLDIIYLDNKYSQSKILFAWMFVNI